METRTNSATRRRRCCSSGRIQRSKLYRCSRKSLRSPLALRRPPTQHMIGRHWRFRLVILCKHSSCLMHNSSCVMHNSSCLMHISSCLMHNSSFLKHSSSCVMHNSSFLKHNSSCLMHNSSCLMHSLSCLMHNSSCVMHNSSCLMHISSCLMQNSSNLCRQRRHPGRTHTPCHLTQTISFLLQNSSFVMCTLMQTYHFNMKWHHNRRARRRSEHACLPRSVPVASSHAEFGVTIRTLPRSRVRGTVGGRSHLADHRHALAL